MGYAKSGQKGCGIHLRQYSRAYIFDDGTKRAAFVTVDACMMHHGIKKAVLKKLSKNYGDTYTFSNFILSGTHTHSAPGGFLMNVMYDLPNLGFIQETFEALVNGIVRSVQRAHESMIEAEIYWNDGEVHGANINRSPASYLFNPAEELKRYQTNVDKTLTQMKIVSKADNKPIGAINWFAVHPTSMNNTNCLISSDNVGYASILLETSMDSSSLPGKSTFVGAFASTNLGDVSPNTAGPKCVNTGLPCEEVRSTCGGEAKSCIAFGPGKDMFQSTEIIAGKMFEKAKELLASSGTEITGSIGYIHQFVEMANETATVQLKNGTVVKVRGCKPAMGYSFAAGTTDGPGEFDFTQATNTTNPFWNLVRDFIFPPSPQDVACHAPKPILIMSGAIKLPYEWQPDVVPTQVVKIGNAFLTAVPGELTTMSGRRMRDAVRQQVIAEGGPSDPKVVVTGLSNMYSSYIATPEEYQLQRYEGASTIFGPHTLTIYLKKYRQLVTAMLKGTKIDVGPLPYQFPNQLISLVPPVLFDLAGWFNNFGDCTQQPPGVVHVGDTVSVKFISGHPRNNLLQEDTFLKVERQTDDKSKWEVVATDSSWETRFGSSAALQNLRASRP
ncbi:unnamed protein product [Acanthoscelides obtectus]|uniref:Neutral ceramidase n=1 Tax=Acanthoscelides obtectus TaxID=200917 RepID=A0A9P0MAX7_ACAOB|nr:unnamed protein product [Acanthoscelides obtectus]CAK1676993.1 Neutral ceramidase [Acanthoscelides obtectus]